MCCQETHREAWDLVPKEELIASTARMRLGDSQVHGLELLHERRVNDAQARLEVKANVCQECFDNCTKTPTMCKCALANHAWIGRWPRLFRDATLAREMLIALARAVATKIVPRPDERSKAETADPQTARSWDFLFHQSGFAGCAVLFGDASRAEALARFPAPDLGTSFAVSFTGPSPQGDERADEAQHRGRARVSRIARLQIEKSAFDAQAAYLRKTNVAYAETTCDADLVAQRCPKGP